MALEPGSGPRDSDLVQSSNDGGVSALHPRLAPPPVRAAPTLEQRFNTVAVRVAPLACWRAHDMRFAFASSFPKPEIRTEMRSLKKLIDFHTIVEPATKKAHPPPLSVFGHADPTGDDESNKILSGRRAQSVYGLLTRDDALLESIFSKPQGHDNWGEPALRIMVGAANPTASQEDREAQVNSARSSAAVRKQLYLRYADVLCVGPDGKPFSVGKQDFLGRGSDPKGKGDIQGCSEFNPVMIFSRDEQREFDSPDETPVRDQENAANRRVVIFLFRPGIRIDPSAWPCPRALEPTAGCRKRFWSDAAVRRANGDERRLYEETHDTFACRFYDRLSNKSPCERFLPQLVPFRYGLEVEDDLPWPLDAILRFASDDGSHIREFKIADGRTVDKLRVFDFDDYRRNLKYRGEVVQGDFIIPLFDSVEIFRVQDPADAEVVLPLPPRTAAETPQAGALVPINFDPGREA